MTLGSFCTSAGVPSAIFRPKSSTTTLSEMPMTSCMWCSTSSTVSPKWSRNPLIVAPRWSTSAWVSPDAGSSSSSSVGLAAIARASSMRLSVPYGQPVGGAEGVLGQAERAEDVHRLLREAALLAGARRCGTVP